MEGGSGGPERELPSGKSDEAFHTLGTAFLDAERRPRSVDDVKSLLGEDYDVLPVRVKHSLESMGEGEMDELARFANWLRERDLVFDLPGGRVCFL